MWIVIAAADFTASLYDSDALIFRRVMLLEGAHVEGRGGLSRYSAEDCQKEALLKVVLLLTALLFNRRPTASRTGTW
jgi:hypothetical protein